MMSINFWLESVIDAFVKACAEGRDWRPDCEAAAAAINSDTPVRVLKQKDLGPVKGLDYSRQHIARLVDEKRFPKPFQLPTSLERDPEGNPRARGVRGKKTTKKSSREAEANP
jgi:predicted DNA-binding transcriptional regulator AlpA